MPRMRSVESSCVAAAGYERAGEEVYIEYVDGDTYAYAPVPYVIWRAFQAADSKGRFVNAVLKPNFPYRRV
ncbi:MAG TPA: KTSC domain-containing protein [Solirubrobacteraceae bacterium]|nr:KTSC domain-containing protein [Solirubrobacteraceae bacterium]